MTLTSSCDFPVSTLIDVDVIVQVDSDAAAVGMVVKRDLRETGETS